jgi:hypothetical protein
MAKALNALLIASPAATKRRAVLVRALERVGFRVLTADRTQRQAAAPDLVVALGSITVLAEVKLMCAVAPHVPIFVAWAGRPEEQFLSEAYAAGATSVVPAERVDVAWENFVRVSRGGRNIEAVHGTLVPGFHDETGRLDATRVAQLMGLTLSQVAKAIGVTTSALSKRSSAAAAQSGLRELEFSWATLLDMLGEAELARAWLHTGHPDFSSEPPLRYLTEGEAA